MTRSIPLMLALSAQCLPGPVDADAGGKHLVYQLKGTATAQPRQIDADGDGVEETTADCFDVDLFDPIKGEKIGTATDCLSSVNVIVDDGGMAPLGQNIALQGDTFFNLPDGTLHTQGLTTVRPVLHPTARDGIVFSHITGANGDGGVIGGTDAFEDVQGEVRLSGQVDMSRLPTESQITFDCIFIIALD